MLTVIRNIVTVPDAGVRMKRLGDVRLAILAVRDCEGVKQFQVVLSRNDFLRIVLEQICHRFKRLSRRKGPRLTTPPTTFVLEHKHWIVALNRRRSITCLKI